MHKEIEIFSQTLLERIKNKKVHVMCHFDTDGITSGAILIKLLERTNVSFSMNIVKQLSYDEIQALPKNKCIILTDLGSGSFNELREIKNDIFIIDHHEIKTENIPENVTILNPHMWKEYEDLCSAELVYCIARTISEEHKDLAHLAVVGMIGDVREGTITKTRNSIITEANVNVKKGLPIYPSTRPLDRTLEFSSRPFIPGVTGNTQGTYELLRESGIERNGNRFKALIDLTEEERKNLTTAVLLRLSKKEKQKDYIGNLYLLKFFNKIEDVREISAMINGCSRMNEPERALLLCLGNSNARRMAERTYVKYRQNIISGLKYIETIDNIEGKEYVIINAKEHIQDTIIGTIASIISFSSLYKKGTVIIAMAYNKDKIKISTRIAGRDDNSTWNLKELMEAITKSIDGDSGGHKLAAGCTINKEDEEKFIQLIQKKLQCVTIKV